MKNIYISWIIIILLIIWFISFSWKENEINNISHQKVPESVTAIYQQASDPLFTEIDIDSSHEYDKNHFAFIWGSVIDINNDGKDEFFITSWVNHSDSFIKYNNWKLVNFITETWINNTQASYGSISIDFNWNWFTDLLVAREKWLYLYTNTWWTFIEEKLDIQFENNSIPVDISVSDIDKDWDLDIYVSTFISAKVFKSASFNNSKNTTNNLLLRNDWDNTFTEVSKLLWTDLKQNTFTSTFIDLNNDGWEDLVVSPNTDTVKIYKNNEWKFELLEKLSDYGFWMWLATSDIDNDWDLDLFFSNTGQSIPLKLLKWDTNQSQKVTSDYLILENLGDFKFKNITSDVLSNQPWFWWGIIPVDFDLDNSNSYLIHQNYIKWAVHKINKLSGELLIKNWDKFIDILSDYNLENRNYWFSSLIWDMNNDGLEDIIYLNIDDWAKAFLRNTDNNNQYLKILLADNNNSLWLKAQLTLDNGTSVTKVLSTKQGIMTDQSNSIIFWLNKQKFNIWRLKLQYLNWDTESFDINNSEKILNLRK
jgi:enediyne biosynthesis protein E4